MVSKAMELQRAAKPHLLVGKGGVAGEVADVRNDVDSAFETFESRDGYPELDWLDITGGALLAAGGDIVLEGRNLLQGQTFDELDLDSVYGVILTALKPGDTGITVEIVPGGATGVVFTPATGVLVITFNDGTDDDDAIATAINADASQCNGYVRATSSSSKNAAAWTAAGAMAAAPMVGGVGDGFEVLVSGVEALPANTTGITGAAAVDDGTVTCTVPALTGETPARAAADIVSIVIKSNGVKTGQLSGVLA